MGINDAAGGGVYHVRDILRELLGHNFVCGLRTLKPKKPFKKFKNSNKPRFFQPCGCPRFAGNGKKKLCANCRGQHF